jgi:histidine triad (HIT) family protein
MAHAIYEDDMVIAVVSARQATRGHVKIFPKLHVTSLDEMNDQLTDRAFTVAKYASVAARDIAQARGSSILVDEDFEHLCINVLPRFEGDFIGLRWDPKKISNSRFKEVFDKIKVAVPQAKEYGI